MSKRLNRCELDKILLGEVHSSRYLPEYFSHLTDVIGARFAGTRGERAAVDYFVDSLSSAGLSGARAEEFEILAWKRGPGASLELRSPCKREFPVTTLPYSPDTGRAGVTAQLVWLPDGTPEEFEAKASAIRGRIVLTREGVPRSYKRAVHRAEKYGRAVKAGAAGFLFANPEPGCLDQTGCARFGRKAEIPAAGVSRETGDFLARMTSRGSVRVTLRTPCSFRKGGSANGVAELRGRSKTGGFLLVGGHVDSHDISPGATDNASGVTVVMEAARALRESGFVPEHTIRFVAFGGEEIGLKGSEAHAKNLGRKASDLRLMINVDCPPLSTPMGFQFRRRAEASAWFTSVRTAGYDPAVVHGLHPHSDHFNFFLAGVPVANMASPDGGGLKTGRGYGHTAADTPDKVDVQGMRLCAGFLAMSLARLAGRNGLRLPHRTGEEIENVIHEDGIDEMLRYEE